MNIIDLHDDLWQRLQARRSRLPHALLLGGRRGLGKFDLARAFAASLLCEQVRESGEACGRCLACNWLSQGNHPDFRLLQPEALAEAESEGEGGEGGKKASQQITIDQVRGLDDFLHVGTHRAGLRVVLVCPAEAMNRSTANALLKTLEEPAPETLFLLVSHEPERLLPTIRSRCQSVAIPTPAPERAAAWLAAAGVGESARWLALAGGAPLLAAELDGSGESRLVGALLEQLQNGQTLDPLAAAAALDKTVKAEKGGSAAPMKRLMEWAQKWIFDLSLANAGLPVRYFIGERARIERLAGEASARGLLDFGRKALQYRRPAEHPLNSRLFLEDFFLAYAALFDRRRSEP